MISPETAISGEITNLRCPKENHKVFLNENIGVFPQKFHLKGDSVHEMTLRLYDARAAFLRKASWVGLERRAPFVLQAL